MCIWVTQQSNAGPSARRWMGTFQVEATVVVAIACFCVNGAGESLRADEPKRLFNQYCIDCHDGPKSEANLDLAALLNTTPFDATHVFENIASGKMPPPDAEKPSGEQRRQMLSWLADQQPEAKRDTFRRISRYEFVQSVNDLLGTKLDLAAKIPEDRGTRSFDSDRRIRLSREMLGSYFTVADEMLDYALPADGFVNEQTWVTRKLKDSHKTYNVYVRDYQGGVLFSWTRANNGNSYSFFYDNFDPPVAGWYELTFEAAKVGKFKGDVSIQVHAGKYYYADDRPQPQRLIDVISVGSSELQSKKIRVFLKPGENVSVHCYSRHNFRNGNPKQGAYIRQMTARGPLQDQWPPSRYAILFGDLPIKMKGNPTREEGTVPKQSNAKPLPTVQVTSPTSRRSAAQFPSAVFRKAWKRKRCRTVQTGRSGTHASSPHSQTHPIL